MIKIGLYYSFNTEKTSHCARRIQKVFEAEGYDVVAVDVNNEMTEEDFMQFDFMVLGIPTWFDGEMPYYWDEFVPAIEDLDMKNKTVAIFGLGNQAASKENFVDALGLLGKLVKQRGAKLVGYTDLEGYDFERSESVEDGKFMGLALDIENQAGLTDERIQNWVLQLKKEF